jgi:hypothetical protein
MMRSRPPRLAGEAVEGCLGQPLVDAAREIPEAFAGGGRDEGGDVEPFEAVMADCHRTQPARGPDPAEDRLQPETVLVGAEDPGGGTRVALRRLGAGLGKVFFERLLLF